MRSNYKSVVSHDFYLHSPQTLFSGNWALLHLEAVEHKKVMQTPQERSISSKSRLLHLNHCSVYLSCDSVEIHYVFLHVEIGSLHLKTLRSKIFLIFFFSPNNTLKIWPNMPWSSSCGLMDASIWLWYMWYITSQVIQMSKPFPLDLCPFPHKLLRESRGLLLPLMSHTVPNCIWDIPVPRCPN